MGGTMRAPLTAMMFAVELTGDGHMAIPLLTACGASYAFTVLVLKRSILTEKLARRGRHITREYSVDPLELALVRDVMVAPVETVPGKMRMSELIHFFGSDRATHKTYPIVDDVGRVIGLASRSDALAAVETAPHADPPLSECLGGRAFPTAQPDEPVAALVARMVQSEAGRVPVIREDGKLVGMVARSDLLRVRARLLMEEEHRQSYVGWRRHKQAA